MKWIHQYLISSMKYNRVDYEMVLFLVLKALLFSQAPFWMWRFLYNLQLILLLHLFSSTLSLCTRWDKIKLLCFILWETCRQSGCKILWHMKRRRMVRRWKWLIFITHRNEALRNYRILKKVLLLENDKSNF